MSIDENRRVDFKKTPTFLIGTMPRSGTNYIQYLLNYYNQMCINNSEDGVELDQSNRNIIDLSKIALGRVIVGHGYCPGFHAACDADDLARWNTLPYFEQYDVMRGPLEDHAFRVSPCLNPNARVVFIHRNPLDQIASIKRHLKNHVTNYIGSLGSNEEEIDRAFVQHYAKLYFTYKIMAEKYPTNVKCYAYELLVSAGKSTILEILKFLGHQPNMKYFDAAFEMTQPESMKRIEKAIGHTLANDLKLGPQEESHIRSGRAGAWKSCTSEDLRTQVERTFLAFGIEQDAFVFE